MNQPTDEEKGSGVISTQQKTPDPFFLECGMMNSEWSRR